MQRTIATLLLLAGGVSAAAVDAADHSRAASGWQQVAKYHVGDLENEADTSDAADNSKSTTGGSPAAGVKDAAYYGEGLSSVSVKAAPASFATAADAASATGCSSCSDCSSCSGFCDSCGCGDNWFCDSFRFEYLGWFTRGRNTPPLVTTSPQGTAAADAGVLGLDTTVLYGNDPIGTNIRSGGRVTWNHLLADECTWADLRFWGLEDGSETFFAASDGNPILARPFFNVLLNEQDAQLIAFTGIAENASIRVLSKNDLIGGDAWLRRNFYQDCCSRVDLLAGYMFTRLDDSIAINTQFTGADPNDAPSFGVQFNINDSFRTQNEFHAGQIGFLASTRRDAITVEALGKIAIGDMRQAVIINGDRTAAPPVGAPISATGGLLALPTNIGSFERHRLAFAPEVNVNLIYEVNPCWRLMTGYSFIYWSNVVLAGNQIDLGVNPSQVPGPIAGPARPVFNFNRTDFWAQGISFGAEYRW